MSTTTAVDIANAAWDHIKESVPSAELIRLEGFGHEVGDHLGDTLQDVTDGNEFIAMAMEDLGYDFDDFDANDVTAELHARIIRFDADAAIHPALTAHEIAEWLSDDRRDLNIYFGNTGGGVLCITADYKDADPDEDDDERKGIVIGTASGNLGWSDYHGDRFGEWDDLDIESAWLGNVELDQAELIIRRILNVLNAELPPSDLCGSCAKPIARGYDSPNNDRANGLRFCERCTDRDAEDLEVDHAQYCEETPPHKAADCPSRTEWDHREPQAPTPTPRVGPLLEVPLNDGSGLVNCNLCPAVNHETYDHLKIDHGIEAEYAGWVPVEDPRIRLSEAITAELRSDRAATPSAADGS